MGSVIGYVLSNVIGFGIAFVLTLLWKFDPDKTA